MTVTTPDRPSALNASGQTRPARGRAAAEPDPRGRHRAAAPQEISPEMSGAEHRDAPSVVPAGAGFQSYSMFSGGRPANAVPVYRSAAGHGSRTRSDAAGRPRAVRPLEFPDGPPLRGGPRGPARTGVPGPSARPLPTDPPRCRVRERPSLRRETRIPRPSPHGGGPPLHRRALRRHERRPLRGRVRAGRAPTRCPAGRPGRRLRPSSAPCCSVVHPPDPSA